MYKQFIKITFVIGMLSHLWISQVAATQTITVRTYELSPLITLSGTVRPKKEVTFTAQLPGRVIEIAGDEGDNFKENTVLVALDDRELLAKRRAAIANLRNAQAAWHNARMQYSRELHSPDSPNSAPGGMGLPHLFDQFITKPLSDLLGQSNSGLDRRAQLHSYGTQIEQADSAVWQAKSQIEQIDAKLRDATSLAPFDGVIIKKLVEVGDTVMMGQALLQFADIERLQIEVDVPARLVRGLQMGKRVSAKLDVLDERIIVEVAQIFPIADEQRHTVKIKFDLAIKPEVESSQYVGPGQYAQIDVPDVKAGQQALLLIPETSVDRRSSLPAVCILNNNKHEVRLVRIGRIINPALIGELDPKLGDYVSVLSGLTVGDQVVINPVSEKIAGKTPCG